MKQITYLAIASILFLSLPARTPAADAESCSAKDMFLEQLENPAETLNTGLKYWILLKKGSALKTVDNSNSFAAQEQIRFQIIPNISGYAYVILQKGSSGAQKILFPNARESSGKMLAGKLYQLPAQGYLKFDNRAGTETIRIVLSRKALDKSSILKDVSDNKITISPASKSTEPLLAANCIAAFSEAETKSIDLSTLTEEFSKDLSYSPDRSRKTGSSRKRTIKRASRKTKKPAVSSAHPVSVARPNAVTVINTDPTERLITEIQLKHI